MTSVRAFSSRRVSRPFWRIKESLESSNFTFSPFNNSTKSPLFGEDLSVVSAEGPSKLLSTTSSSLMVQAPLCPAINVQTEGAAKFRGGHTAEAERISCAGPSTYHQLSHIHNRKSHTFSSCYYKRQQQLLLFFFLWIVTGLGISSSGCVGQERKAASQNLLGVQLSHLLPRTHGWQGSGSGYYLVLP